MSATLSGLFDWSGLATDLWVLLARARSAPAPLGHHDQPWFGLWQEFEQAAEVGVAEAAALELLDIARQRAHEAGVVRECLYLVALVELGRARPGDEPVASPTFDELNATHQETLAAALELTERELTRSITNEVRAMLAHCLIVFLGNQQEITKSLAANRESGQSVRSKRSNRKPADR